MQSLVQFLKKLANMRSALSALIIATITLAAASGFKVPENFGELAQHWLEAALAFCSSIVLVSSAFHADSPTQAAVKKSNLTSMVFCVFSVLLFSGCSSFMHFSDPTWDDAVGKFCGEQAEKRKLELDAESERTGISPADLLVIFKEACVLRMKRGGEDASEHAMGAVRAKASVRRDP